MNISINGRAADIILESERTLGEVLSGLDNWLQGSGYRLSGLELDGEAVGAEAIPAVFSRDINDIHRLNILTSARFQLLEDALDDTLTYLKTLETIDSGERKPLANAWEGGVAASFLAAESPDLFNDIVQRLKGNGALDILHPLIEERLREVRNPLGELAALEGIVTGIIKRLEDLPLDIQTGKDSRAAETVALFSNVAEKLFRIFMLMGFQKGSPRCLLVDGMPIETFLDEFSAALRELLAAYEAKDSVLVGDLAEYELAPRLHTFYGVITAPQLSGTGG